MKTKIKFLILAIFGFAMGIMESIIVVYIRKIIGGIDVVNLTNLVVSKIPVIFAIHNLRYQGM